MEVGEREVKMAHDDPGKANQTFARDELNSPLQWTRTCLILLSLLLPSTTRRRPRWCTSALTGYPWLISG